MVLVVALLYYATPNVKQPKFRWVSVGAGVAIVAWLIASLLFALYVANFSNYNKTYGSLGGVIVALLWLWITNLALLLGAEIDSEMERGRELQAGIPAEKDLQLPARDTRNIEKAEKKEAEDIERGRELRLASERNGHANDNEEGDNQMRKLTMLTAGAVGYVLGARAGRERYEQIKSGAAEAEEQPDACSGRPARPAPRSRRTHRWSRTRSPRPPRPPRSAAQEKLDRSGNDGDAQATAPAAAASHPQG